MQQLSPYILQSIIQGINPKLIENLTKYLYDRNLEISKEEWVAEYIKSLLTAYFLPEKGQLIDFNSIRRKQVKRRQDNKRSWYRTLLEEAERPNNPIEQEYNLIKSIIDRLNEEQQKILGADSLDSFTSKKLEEIEAWRKERQAPISSYPYLHTKKMSQIKLALTIDIVYDLAEFLIANDQQFEKATMFQVEALVNHPIFSGKSYSLDTELTKNSKETSLYNDYIVDDELVLRTIIRLNEGDTLSVKKNTTLDQKDSAIFQYIMSQRDEMFYTDRTIMVDLSSLVKVIYNTDSKKCYDLVEKRLMKIKNYDIEAIINNKDSNQRSSVAYSILDRVFIGQDEKRNKGKYFVEVVVGDTIYKQVINSRTIKIYRDSMSKLNNPLSKVLIYALQKERLEKHINKKPFTDLYTYKYFTNRARFKNANQVERNLNEIYTALQEFKEQNILIKNFKQIYQSFEIEFIPLSLNEIYDFFEEKTNTISQLS
ncbi:replication initiator protein A (plasmid) [Alkalihalophilus pseudofirmus]|uniref:replication initiator protein A n=1 Tax=Alkalihalophilus pseudofirmus TaxID=79885 RepID=UPI00259B9974|nr:replication initiator protein A [Alkalihalophilus pseudofirmus]WEG19213.1 replication initiator protein A [Alkalihalophilus pseudofirmus]